MPFVNRQKIFQEDNSMTFRSDLAVVIEHCGLLVGGISTCEPESVSSTVASDVPPETTWFAAYRLAVVGEPQRHPPCKGLVRSKQLPPLVRSKPLPPERKIAAYRLTSPPPSSPAGPHLPTSRPARAAGRDLVDPVDRASPSATARLGWRGASLRRLSADPHHQAARPSRRRPASAGPRRRQPH